MTGTGTAADPYIPANWGELVTAAETADVYIRFAAGTQWDMNEQYPEDTPGINLRCMEIDFNGAVIKNLRKSAYSLFAYSATGHDVLLKNGVFSSMYITGAEIFFAIGYSGSRAIKLFNMAFGGEMYDSRLWSCDLYGVETDSCAFSFYLSNSRVTNNDKPLANTTLNFDGTVDTGIGTLNLVSSAVYGEIRAVGAQYGMSFSGELCVCDITLSNFSTIMYVGDKTTAVMNIDKIGGAEIMGNPCIQATSTQMKDAAWLNEHGFPCK